MGAQLRSPAGVATHFAAALLIVICLHPLPANARGHLLIDPEEPLRIDDPPEDRVVPHVVESPTSLPPHQTEFRLSTGAEGFPEDIDAAIYESKELEHGRRRFSPDQEARRQRMGLTAAQQKAVDFYLNKIRDLQNKLYPEISAKDELESKMVGSWSRRMKADVTSPEENSKYFEGDIVLFPDQAKQLYERALNSGKRRVKRKFIGSSLRRWDPKRPIVYSFDGSHTAREQKIIELALEHWHNITCLEFTRNDHARSGNRIVFTDVDGCASNVGRHPIGEEQLVSLAPECIRLGVIAHEVAHALGFWHEQSRPDRDQFVRVRWENIDKDSKGQFLKEEPDDVDNAGVPYDYGSIMHYRFEDLYTINTFVSDYQKTIGQRDQLSFNDIQLMNKIYCNDVCPIQLPCQRGGYTDPRKCPDGFKGRLCEEVMPGYGAVCGQECSWLLQAPPGMIVEMQFYGEFEMYCKVRHSLCMDYIEVRNSTDFANTGMRENANLGKSSCARAGWQLDIVGCVVGLHCKLRSLWIENEDPHVPPGNGMPLNCNCRAVSEEYPSRSKFATISRAPDSARSGEPTTESAPDFWHYYEVPDARRNLTSQDIGFSKKFSERTVMEPCQSACCPGFSLIGDRCVR